MNDVQTPARKLQRRFLGGGNAPTVDLERRTCELSFSSTARVDRPFGVEVLSHKPGAADLSRLNGGAPLLFNHDPGDILGVVERAFISGDKGRAVVRFGRDERGEWAMRQAADGVLVNVSFSYCVRTYSDSANGDLVATSWEALEISLVTVPADFSVGIGRSLNLKGNYMSTDDMSNQGQRGTRSERAVQMQHTLLEQTRAASAAERERVIEIGAMGRHFKLPDSTILEMQQDGSTVDEARARTAQMVSMRQRSTPTVRVDDDGGIGLSAEETQSFSLVRAINAVISKDWSAAGLERAASRAMEGRNSRSTQGFFVPPEVMRRGQWSAQRAAYAVGTNITGGALVETGLHADQFIEVLRNSALVLQAGATVLPGLQGNVDIPRQVSPTPAYWVGESGGVSEGEGAFDAVQLRPKTVGALSKMSRLMLMQSTPAIEMLARNDMAKSLALAIDRAALSGSGSANQPLGLANATGLSSLMLGANGASVTLDTMVALETKANDFNAPVEGRGYFINPRTAGVLKTQKSSTGQYLWTDSPPGQRSGTPHMFNGYPVYVTNQVRNNLTKGSSAGVCSELFFGAWPELVIGEWGALEILVNQYGGDVSGFASGDVWIRALQTVDVGVRLPGAFVACSDALTA